MSVLFFRFLFLHLLSNCVSSKQFGLHEAVKDEPMVKNENGDKYEELMQRMERMDINWKMEKAHLETKL